MFDSMKVNFSPNVRNSSFKAQAKVAPRAKDFLYSRRMQIDQWIVKARKMRGWTQDQLAEQLNVSRANVSHWEKNKHEPSIAHIKRIGELCGADPADIFRDNINEASQITPIAPSRLWPFSFDFEIFDRLPAPRKAEAELILRGYIAQSEDRQDSAVRGTG